MTTTMTLERPTPAAQAATDARELRATLAEFRDASEALVDAIDRLDAWEAALLAAHADPDGFREHAMVYRVALARYSGAASAAEDALHTIDGVLCAVLARMPAPRLSGPRS